jgi:hypothetical protein
MESLGDLSIQSILDKVKSYEKARINHNNRMKRYRETHLEHAKEYGRKKAKELYWKKKGYIIDENGEKKKIEPI